MQKKSNFLVLVGFMSAIFLNSICFALQGGGTESDPFLISSFEDFEEFRTTPAFWESGIYTRLETDIDLDPELEGRQTYTTVPIQNYSGNFNGGGFALINLKIDINNTPSLEAGLIGELLENGTVINLKLENINYEVKGYQNIELGAIAGENNGTISCCSATGIIDADSTGTNDIYEVECGGIVGNNKGTISISFTEVTVTATTAVNEVVDYNESSAGGIAGNNDGIIEDCYSKGDSTANNDYACSGGIVGFTDATAIVRRCYSTGTAEVNSSFNGECEGAIIGENYMGQVEGCFFDIETSNNVRGVGDDWNGDADVQEKETLEMKTLDTYLDAGWDFTNESVNGTDDNWRMCSDGIDYPRLWHEFSPSDFVCGDGVDLIDFSYLANYWGLDDCNGLDDCGRADIDNSGDVGVSDLLFVVEDWLDY